MLSSGLEIYANNLKDTKKKIGILGGSYDPIHFGHIKPSLELAKTYRLDRIILLPCKVSPFKESTFASAEHRWNMVSMVAANEDLFVADARELERDTPSYTYLTLAELTQELGDRYQLYWILGIDSLLDFPDWYESEKIMQLCHILVLRRPGYELPHDNAKLDWLNQYLSTDINQLDSADTGHIYITETELLDISSTAIRETIKAGEQPRYMLPGGVWNYIRRNRLYQR